VRSERTAGWWALRLIATLVLLLIGLLIYAYWEATWDPDVRRADVAVADWPKGAKPVTVLLVSDTHVAGPDMPPERLARIVDQLNGLKPDLVLLAGDYIGHKASSTVAYPPDAAVAPLGRFKAPLGTLAVLGNHDVSASPVVFADALRAQHITLLAKQAVRRGPLIIGGTDDGFAEGPAAEPTLKAMDALGPGPKILLTHVPNVARSLKNPSPLSLQGTRIAARSCFHSMDL
jgi:predicted MPP superfamily phosphohydrolase